jgi:hypothetical protein
MATKWVRQYKCWGDFYIEYPKGGGKQLIVQYGTDTPAQATRTGKRILADLAVAVSVSAGNLSPASQTI